MSDSSIIWRPSPNYGPRKNNISPDMIIIHYTGTDSADEAANYYLNKEIDENCGKISPHYMIARDGTVIQFVSEDMRAWHAGKSCWKGDRDINSRSIGIELVNPGHEKTYMPFTESQMLSLISLCLNILKRHSVPAENILGHSDVAPGRKKDPGELFDWQRLAKKGVGFWPEETEEEESDIDGKLISLGYDPDVTPEDRLKAFQMHYVPVIAKDDEDLLKLTSRKLAGF